MSTLRARVASLDPLLAVVALVSLVVYALHGFDGALSRDLGVYMYGAQRFLAGEPPYVGILNRAGPLAHAIPAVGIAVGRVVGIGDIHAARMFYLLLSVACVCLVHVLSTRLFGSRWAGLVAAAGFLTFQGFLDMASNGPREKTAMVLFLLAALLALAHRRWATAGVFVALATLTWQPVFAVLLVVGVVAILLAPTRRLEALLRVAVGGIVPTLVVGVYYALEGALHAFFEGFVLINAKYTSQRGGTALSATWKVLQEGYGASWWLILLGLLALPVLAAVTVPAAVRSRETVPTTLVALGAGLVAGVVWSAFAFNGWPDLFVLLPFAAVGLGGLAALLLRRLDGRAAMATAAALAVAATVLAVVTSVTTRESTLLVQRASVAAILHNGPPHATIVSVQAPEALVIAHRRNPTAVQMFGGGFARYVDHTWPGGIAGYTRWLARTRPTFVVTQRGLDYPWLNPVLAQDYRRVGQGPQFSWYASTRLSPARRRKILSANAAAVHR